MSTPGENPRYVGKTITINGREALVLISSGATYYWPVTNGASNTAMYTDGSGSLIFADPQKHKVRQEITTVSDTISANTHLAAILTNTVVSDAGTVVYLPTATASGQNKQVTIVDEAGVAGNFGQSISIKTSGGDSLLGTDTFILSQNYNSITLYTNGSDAWFVGSI